jgi:hypothetical protein
MIDDESIARLIADGSPPDWLTPIVEKLRRTLDWSIKHEASYPTREALRTKLETLGAAVEVVRRNLTDLEISELLLAGDDLFEHQNEMYHGLSSLAVRVSRVLNEIRPGGGRDKHYAHEGLSSQVNCALMVCIAWDRVRGEWPANSDPVAHRACGALWKAAGGGAGWGGCSEVVWRDHIRAAKKAATSQEAVHIEGYFPAPPGGL